MIEDRRSFLRDTGRLLLLTGAASLAWEHVLAGDARGGAQLRRSPITGGG